MTRVLLLAIGIALATLTACSSDIEAIRRLDVVGGMAATEAPSP